MKKLIIATLGLGLLVPHSRGRERAGKPSILPARVMREPGVRLGVTLSCLLFLMIGGFMYNFAILSQIGLGYTPLESGLATLTLALAFVTSSVIAPRLVSRAGGPARSQSGVEKAWGLTWRPHAPGRRGAGAPRRPAPRCRPSRR